MKLVLLALLMTFGYSCGSNHVVDKIGISPGTTPILQADPGTTPFSAYTNLEVSCNMGIPVQVVNNGNVNDITPVPCTDPHMFVSIGAESTILCPAAPNPNAGSVRYRSTEGGSYVFKKYCTPGNPVALDAQGGLFQFLCPVDGEFKYKYYRPPIQIKTDGTFLCTEGSVISSTLFGTFAWEFTCPSNNHFSLRYSQTVPYLNLGDGDFFDYPCTANTLVSFGTLTPYTENTIPIL